MSIHLGNQEELFKDIDNNSIDAILTDPPYGLNWKHKIETGFNFENFIDNCYRVLKDNGFLVYFGQEPSISYWNYVSQQKFNYLSEIIWYKRGNSAPYHYPLRVHEKIMIFTKGKGKLNKATVEWEWEKEELIEYTSKENILKNMAELKKLIKGKASIEEVLKVANDNKSQRKSVSNKVNDDIYKRKKYKTPHINYIFYPKKLTTLWGCRSHNQQGHKEEFNIKHPAVKPIQIMERLIEMTTQETQVVLDPFMGSGTTGIACNNLKRNFIGFELLQEYYNIAQKRLKQVL